MSTFHHSMQDWEDAVWESRKKAYKRRQEEASAPLFTKFLKFTVILYALLVIALLTYVYLVGV